MERMIAFECVSQFRFCTNLVPVLSIALSFNIFPEPEIDTDTAIITDNSTLILGIEPETPRHHASNYERDQGTFYLFLLLIFIGV